MGRLLIQFAGTNTTKALSETLPKNTIIVDEDLHQLRLHDGTTPGGHIIGTSGGSGVPVGTIIPFAGNSIPEGYLLCDGSAISRTDYAILFSVIGTIYGAGNGNSTFNLPNCRNRVPMMLDETQYVPESSNKQFLGYLPNIVGELGGVENLITGQSGAFYRGGSNGSYFFRANAGTQTPVSFDASRCSESYGRGGLTYNNVIPASVSVKEIIRYI